MSTARRGTWGPKGTGPTGRPLCYCGCGREVPKPSRTKFSFKCWTDWAAKNDPARQRSLVDDRDHGVCALCAVDTYKRAREARDTKRLLYWLARRHAEELFARKEAPSDFPDAPMHAWSECHDWAEHWVSEQMKRRFGEYEGASGHTWEMDHIIPVCEGGGCCDLDNLRTLCLPCHRKETAKLASRRAAARKQKKEVPQLVLI